MRSPKVDCNLFDVGTPVLIHWGHGPSIHAIKTYTISEDARIQYDKQRGLYVEFSVIEVTIVFDYPLHTNKSIEPKWTVELPIGPSVMIGDQPWWAMKTWAIQGRMVIKLSPRYGQDTQ